MGKVIMISPSQSSRGHSPAASRSIDHQSLVECNFVHSLALFLVEVIDHYLRSGSTTTYVVTGATAPDGSIRIGQVRKAINPQWRRGQISKGGYDRERHESRRVTTTARAVNSKSPSGPSATRCASLTRPSW